MRQWTWRLFLPCLLVGLTGGAGRADEPTADQKLVKQVMDRLLAVIHETPAEYAWPPQYKILNDKETQQIGDEYNAMAGPLFLDEKTDTLTEFVKDEKTGQIKTMVIITPKFMKEIIEGDADELGCVLGHELSHLLLKHSLRDRTSDTPFTKVNFTRDQETQADLLGEELALKAGFSYKGFVTIYTKLETKLGDKYTSFEGLNKDHPAPKDRIAMLDKEHGKLWHAMSAYESGVDFLALEQYASAERCFQDVTEQFPDAYDAWANLGYARLMQYCDELEPADIKRFDVGHVLTGGFYLRPKSLEVKTRGIDEKLWKSAVDALQTAVKLQPDLVLAKANLGIAYLVAPDGKDVKKADKWLQPAAAAAAKDEKMEPLDRATVLTNAGVADLAAGRADDAAAKLHQADKIAGEVLKAGTDRRAKYPALVSALSFNLALAEGASTNKDKQKEALAFWGGYFMTATPSSNWWGVGYDHYAEVSKALGVVAKTSDELIAATARVVVLRQATSVKLANGKSVVLSEPVADVQKRLGAGVMIPVPESKLVRLCYPDLGVEVLGSDRVAAIYLVGPKAPALPIKTAELGSNFFNVTVGMTRKDLDAGLAALAGYDFREVIEPQEYYRYYPDMGFGVRLDKGLVSEVVLAVVPRTEPAQP